MSGQSRGVLTGFEPVRVRLSERTTYLFFRLQTDGGATGLGEASFGGGDAAVVRIAGEMWSRCLVGREVGGIGRLVGRLHAEVRRLGHPPVVAVATAESALEQALWDLRGQQLGVPIYEMLGGARRNELRLYANVNRGLAERSAAGFAEAMRAALGDGFTALKCAPFDELIGRTPNLGDAEPGIARVFAVRAAIDPDGDLMVDCHGRLDVDLAPAVAERMGELRLRWFEEPIDSYRYVDLAEDVAVDLAGTTRNGRRAGLADPDQLGKLAAQIDIPLAGGECLYGVHEMGRLLSTGAVGYAMPDVKHCGGIGELHRIGILAESLGVRVSPHNPSGPVATLATAHVAAALPSFDLLEHQWGEPPWRGELVDPPEALEAGQLLLSDAAGLGVRLNDRLASEHSAPLEGS